METLHIIILKNYAILDIINIILLRENTSIQQCTIGKNLDIITNVKIVQDISTSSYI